MPTTTPALDAMLLPSEQVIFRAGRKIRTTILWSLFAFAAISVAIWLIPIELTNRLAWAIGVGAASAILAAIELPNAQVIVTDARLLIRIGLPLVDESVTALADIARIERGIREVYVILRDGELLPISVLPSLAELNTKIVELTGVDAPVFLPPRLKPWSVLTMGLWWAGFAAGPCLLVLAVAALDGRDCFERCSETVDFVSGGVLLGLFLPSILFGGLFGLGVAVAVLRSALPVTDTRMIFEASLSPPTMHTWLDRIAASLAYFPARRARRLATALYGEQV